jgi:hypothetical protein
MQIQRKTDIVENSGTDIPCLTAERVRKIYLNYILRFLSIHQNAKNNIKTIARAIDIALTNNSDTTV